MVWTDELDLTVTDFLHRFGKAGRYLTHKRKCNKYDNGAKIHCLLLGDNFKLFKNLYLV